MSRNPWPKWWVAAVCVVLQTGVAAADVPNSSTNWTNQLPANLFAPRGVNGYVFALAQHFDVASGHWRIVVGGEFSQAGSVPVRNIAAWDPLDRKWSPVGGGVDGAVHALIEVGTTLYVGGEFTHALSAGGAPSLVNHMTGWSGSTWQVCGPPDAPGLNGPVYAFCPYVEGTDAFLVGGRFTTAGSTSSRNITLFQGDFSSNLFTLGAWSDVVGHPSAVYAITRFLTGPHTAVYAIGGDFNRVGFGIPVSNVAGWQVAISSDNWTTLGNGLPSGAVFALLQDPAVPNRLIAGGEFFTETIENLASFDPTVLDWQPVLGGVGGTNGPVYALSSYDNCGAPDLIVGGAFNLVNDIAVNSICDISPQVVHVRSVSDMQAGTGSYLSPVFAILSVSDIDACPSATLYAGGWFGHAGALGNVGSIATWTSTDSWKALQEPSLLACGSNISCDLGGGIGPVNPGGSTLLVTGGKLVVGGGFSQVGAYEVANIASWNGKVWAPMGEGLNGTVRALLNADVIVGSPGIIAAGGDFTASGSTMLEHIALWNGSAWSFLPGTDGPINALTIYKNELVAAGSFAFAGGMLSANIARWNGRTWQPFGTGTDGAVMTLATRDTSLYVGGAFTHAGGSSASHLARWNGSTWSAMGSGVDDTALVLLRNGNTLYAGGRFTHAGGGAAAYIASWNGSAWSALDGNLAPDRPVCSLAAYNGRIMAGMRGFTSDSLTVDGIGQWTGSTWDSLGTGLEMLARDGRYAPVSVSALAEYQGGLYCVGAFTVAGGHSSQGMATWGDSVYVTGVGAPPTHAFGGAVDLSPAWPNPFQAQSTVDFNWLETGSADRSVFDGTGRRVATLASGQLSAGQHRAAWNGKDGAGRDVGPGLFFVRLQTAGGSVTRSLIHIR